MSATGDMIFFSIPDVPPSVNHYVKHTRTGQHYKTDAARQFEQLVSIYGNGKSIRAKKYLVNIWVLLGHKQKGDVDNFAKVVLDSLVKCGVIHSDSAVTDLFMRKGRDIANPRTEIMVKAI